MMLTAKYFVENAVKVNYGMLFVANSGEEGLGNLKGTRKLISDYGGKVKRFVSYDFVYPAISNKCVGSHRYEVEVLTKGGHSWGDFGEKNAIAILAGIANEIYSIRLPEKPDKKVTFNVGTISGGTSVNTIAQRAHMLCEYRFDDEELLDFMRSKFAEIFAKAGSDDVSVNVTLIGERPCMGDVDLKKQQALCDLASEVLEDVVGQKPVYCSSSTDCNVPLSLGIPAIAVGVYKGEGCHTREEWILKDSLRPGLELGIKTALAISK